MERILIGRESEILIGNGLPRPLLPSRPERRKAALLTQPGAEHLAQAMLGQLREEGLEAAVHVLPDGEAAKDLAAVEGVYRWLAEEQHGRDDTLVGVGGGAATDAAGFVAGTWLRGVEVVHVPTTLLGAVDASIGGKAGVNIGGKNLVGVFWHPRRVVVDLEALEKLPDELKRQGAAEIIKAGLLARPGLVEAYRRQGLAVPLREVVPVAIRIKADIVTEDFTERGRRALLNLGHTIGHGVEFASGLSHGEAVAIGLVAAAAVSEHRLGFGEALEVKAALQAAGLPTTAPPLRREEVIRLIGLDKKRAAGRIRMVLLEGPGRPRLMDVTREDVVRGLDAVGL